ncbi:MAG: TFIIH/NER complex subunit [Peltula sp. TS41687]|nr:MAG: TFIIH/NER complex subunit [Peltula sp. TS41687]
MSKATTTTKPSPQTRLRAEEDDICPVCKSSRYLNPNMRFLLNPECYHKMCESCVDRIFSHGPAPCPIAGCHRTLRKQRFRKQTFEDMRVEKEVDVRRRVGKIFNRREEDFTTLKAYNDYLEKVESVTFNLLNNVDAAATEAELASYAKANADSISHNIAMEQQDVADQEAQRAAERERARERREKARKEDEEDRAIVKEGRKEVIDLLATSGAADSSTAETIARKGKQKIQLKRSSVAKKRGRQPKTQPADKEEEKQTHGFQIHGLKAPPRPRLGAGGAGGKEADDDAGYDPFMGLARLNEPDYFVLDTGVVEPGEVPYYHQWLRDSKSDPTITAGGYDLREWYVRCLTEAWEGLGVFVMEEMGGGERVRASRELEAAEGMGMLAG